MYSKQFILINILKEAVLHYDLIELLTFTRTSRILCIYKNQKFDMNNLILDTNIFNKWQQIVILSLARNLILSCIFSRRK